MNTDQRDDDAWSAGLQRVALWVVIASVAAAALMGVAALLVGGFGETQGRVLGTTFIILGASLLIMATAPAMTRSWLRPVPEIGIGLTIGGFGILSVLMWTDAWPEGLVKLSVVLIIWAVAVAHGSLLSAARLEDAFAWVQWAAYASITALGVILTISIFNEFAGGDSVGRLIGVIAIAVASSSIAVPVFHRMSQLDEAPIDFGTRPPDSRTYGYCPACGARVREHQSGEQLLCPVCGVRTVVHVSDEEGTTGASEE